MSTVSSDNSTAEYVTVTVDGQMFGIPVLSVQDVLGPQKITRIPLSPPEIAGVLNLRGRIVTAIDLRRRLRLAARPEGERGMSVVVEHKGEPYSLIVDSVGEVMALPESAFERNPPTLSARWREISGGIYRLDGKLLVVLEVDKALDFGPVAEAA
ncbi:chemotaxis protein CheW [Desertibaculum subflavum]|uniref:chemotaxis protein CheW n=1 Tax=Desertibaculum subflavum TaxID=2268458 RepID=UPI000E65ECA3